MKPQGFLGRLAFGLANVIPSLCVAPGVTWDMRRRAKIGSDRDMTDATLTPGCNRRTSARRRYCDARIAQIDMLRGLVIADGARPRARLFLHWRRPRRQSARSDDNNCMALYDTLGSRISARRRSCCSRVFRAYLHWRGKRVGRLSQFLMTRALVDFSGSNRAEFSGWSSDPVSVLLCR